MDQKSYIKQMEFNKWLYIVDNSPPDFPWLVIAISPDNKNVGLEITQAFKQDDKNVILKTKELGTITINAENIWQFKNGKTHKGLTIWSQGL